MINRVILTGRLVKDLDIRWTTGANPKAVTNFTIANTDRYNKENTNFINCVAWGSLAEHMAKHVGKGCRIEVDGRITTSNYMNHEGISRKKTEIVCESIYFIDYANDRNSSDVGREYDNHRRQQQGGQYGRFNQQEQQKPIVYDGGMYASEQRQKQQDPFGEFGSSLDISDDDLPF